MGILSGIPSVASIRKKAESTINGSIDEIMNNPDLDEDYIQKKVEAELGIDDTIKEKYEQGKKVVNTFNTVKDIWSNPKGFAVNLVKEKAIEYAQQRPEVEALKEKIMNYAKSKVEVMPQYQSAVNEIESLKSQVSKEPQKLMKEMQNPEEFALSRYHKIFG